MIDEKLPFVESSKSRKGMYVVSDPSFYIGFRFVGTT